MGYYKVRIEVRCDWNPAESDLDDITQAMGVGEAICIMREIIAVVDRPKDIEDEEAMSFLGSCSTDAWPQSSIHFSRSFIRICPPVNRLFVAVTLSRSTRRAIVL